jgi:site-specific DNA recombinase
MTASKALRCAIYTRVSTDAGLEQEFNSLDAQREAAEAYVKSQTHEGWRLVPRSYDDGGYSGGNMDRPGLKKLLSDIEAGEIDVIVVYKVDRLTRSLADFAKLVELFDKHGVSFVSVTQAFNTTTSMGRLTLNVLLSFAQFEREVTGERIRDKVAASKKKGIWMGGWVPFGYHLDERKLLIEPKEAEIVRLIFRLYLELGSMPRLLIELRRRGVRTRVRQASNRQVGGIPFTLGPLCYLLNNRVYLGDISHKGVIYPGEHEAILDRTTFEAAQALGASNTVKRRAATASHALLSGKIFDDRGNIMTPTYSQKNGRQYRYYVSRAFIEGRKGQAGSVPRVPAHRIEVMVLQAVKSALSCSGRDPAQLAGEISRVVVEAGQVLVDLEEMSGSPSIDKAIRLPWTHSPQKVKRTILHPHMDATKDARPIQAGCRKVLLRSVVNGRQWLRELLAGEVMGYREIAEREGRSERSVAMTVSLAFVAPNIIEAAIKGALPRGIGVTRLMNLPPLWADQYTTLGLRTG